MKTEFYEKLRKVKNMEQLKSFLKNEVNYKKVTASKHLYE
tara:strand:- start:931 stop:1050 length:120 start_codon:yes stop_codon:yes gene_type:complete